MMAQSSVTRAAGPCRRLHGPAARATVALMAMLLFASVAIAQPRKSLLDDIGIDQKLAAQVPTDLTFTDETGKTVHLSDYITGNRPIILSLVYYQCPMLC